jgi:hypothetical protein
LEGDRELAWYHRRDLGFAGRRPLLAPETSDAGGSADAPR